MKYFVFIIVGWTLQIGSLQAQLTDFSHINFAKADSIAARYPNHTLHDIKNLADKLTVPLSTPVEKFRAIYVWVSTNIQNDHKLFTKNKTKREKIKDPEALRNWNKEFSKQVFKVLVDKHKTVCTGYAYLIRELAFHAGIKAIIVDGYGRTAVANIGGNGVPNHSWNAVLLNDKWYVCDATWSSGAIDLTSKNFIKKLDLAYFLADPALFARNHYPLDTAQMFLTHKPSLDEFLNGPLTYTPIYTYNINTISPDRFIIHTTKNQPVHFTVTKNEKPVNIVLLQLLQFNKPTLVNVHAIESPEGLFSFTHTFTSKGTFTAHLLFDDNYICTFSIHVK